MKGKIRHNRLLLVVLSVVLCACAAYFGMDRLLGATHDEVRGVLSVQMARLQQAAALREATWSGAFVRDLVVLARSERVAAYAEGLQGLGLDAATLRSLSSPGIAARESVVSGVAARLPEAEGEKVRRFAENSVFVRQLFMEALRHDGYERIAILTPDDEAVLQTDDGGRLLSRADRAAIARCLAEGRITALPAYRVGETLRVDVAVPLFAAGAPLPAGTGPAPAAEGAGEVTQSPSSGSDGARGRLAPVPALILVTMDLRDRLLLMADSGAMGAMAATGDGEGPVHRGSVRQDADAAPVEHLVAQQNADGSLSLLGCTGSGVSSPLQGWQAEGDLIPFDLRRLPGHAGPAYTMGERLASTNLFCLVALDEAAAMEGLRQGLFVRRAVILAVVLGGMLLLLLLWLAFFASRELRIRRVTSVQADRDNRRRQVLGYLDQEMHLPVACCDFDLTLLYVNDAFARMAGRPVSRLTGSNVRVLPQDLAVNLGRHCESVWATGTVQRFEDRISENGVWKPWHVLACPYVDREGYLAGVIGIYRDAGEEEAGKKRREELGEQAVAALHGLVAACDPRLGRLSLMIAETAVLLARLDGDGSPGTRRLLSIAGRLCKVGELAGAFEGGRTRDGRAGAGSGTVDVAAVAGSVLGSLDFGELPVVRCISDMNERLDGSGHPRGLKGEEIGRDARCLAIADVFCRALLDGGGRAEAVDACFAQVLLAEPARFDHDLAGRLQRFLMTPQGRKEVQRLLSPK